MDITGIDSRKCRQEFKGSLLMGCSGLLDSMHMNMYCPMTEEVHGKSLSMRVLYYELMDY